MTEMSEYEDLMKRKKMKEAGKEWDKGKNSDLSDTFTEDRDRYDESPRDYCQDEEQIIANAIEVGVLYEPPEE